MSTAIETSPVDAERGVSRRLAGKVAVVTGGSTGMGFATAKRFAQEGVDHVFITGRRKDALDSAIGEIGEKATGVQGDVANLSDIDRIYDAVCEYGRKINVIFANAGVARLGAIFSFSVIRSRRVAHDIPGPPQMAGNKEAQNLPDRLTGHTDETHNQGNGLAQFRA